ncbi:MAG: 4Fe-4S dicluster domain-containing protein [Coriobacteriaceae bacterium]|nr:4Fe-4S dicluster domain-containing protein [Coriobacteriaceae bacterium]
MSKQMAFYVDTSVCVGCKTCEIACKDEKNLSVGPRPRYVRALMGGSWKADEKNPTVLRQDIPVFSYHVSISCNHCANPFCVAVCPAGSMQKDEETGIVSNDHETCIGCESCYAACPYKAPQLVVEDNLVYKCDFCRELLDMGMAPACVETCPMRALSYGDYDELVKKYGDIRDIEPLPDSSQTLPSLVLKPHPDIKAGTPVYSTDLYVTDR